MFTTKVFHVCFIHMIYRDVTQDNWIKNHRCVTLLKNFTSLHVFWTTKVNQSKAHLTFMQECCKSCDKTLKLMFLPFFFSLLRLLFFRVERHVTTVWTIRRKETCTLYVNYIAQFARLHIPHVTWGKFLCIFFFLYFFLILNKKKTGKRET